MLQEMEDLNAQGNWAKHAPPPSADAPLRATPQGAVRAEVFEEFWIKRRISPCHKKGKHIVHGTEKLVLELGGVG